MSKYYQIWFVKFYLDDERICSFEASMRTLSQEYSVKFKNHKNVDRFLNRLESQKSKSNSSKTSVSCIEKVQLSEG
jgi:hypothetical protein